MACDTKPSGKRPATNSACHCPCCSCSRCLRSSAAMPASSCSLGARINRPRCLRRKYTGADCKAIANAACCATLAWPPKYSEAMSVNANSPSGAQSHSNCKSISAAKVLASSIMLCASGFSKRSQTSLAFSLSFLPDKPVACHDWASPSPAVDCTVAALMSPPSS